MRISTFLTTVLVTIATATTDQSSTSSSSSSETTSVTHSVLSSAPPPPIILTIPVSPILPNPSFLPPSTRAILSAPGLRLEQPLTVRNTFEFPGVPAGSYLVDVFCPTHGFAAVRLDVGGDGEVMVVGAWETFRGGDWGNKGEVVAVREGGKVVEMRVLGERDWFVERPKFSVLSLFKNPMILMAGVSLIMFMGMPWLMDNMDPELRAEFEESQKKGILGALNGGREKQVAPGVNFDMAAYLAGGNKKKGETTQSGGVRR